MSFERKALRNKLRRKFGNKHIAYIWDLLHNRQSSYDKHMSMREAVTNYVNKH